MEKAATLMIKEMPSEVELVSLKDTLEQLARKRDKLTELDERIAALLEKPDEIEKEAFKTEGIPDDIDETSSQISSFLHMISSKKTRNPLPFTTTGKSLLLPVSNTSEQIASGIHDHQPPPLETSTTQVNGRPRLPLEPQGATNEISQVFLQVIQDSSHVHPPQQNPTSSSAPHLSNNQTTSPHNHSSRLPKLNLPTFSGNPLRWFTFWDSFEAAVHSNTSLGGVQEFTYLKDQFMGDALRAVTGFPLTNSNYQQAVTLLRERFGQPNKIINAHMQALLDLSKPIYELSSLQVFYDTMENHGPSNSNNNPQTTSQYHQPSPAHVHTTLAPIHPTPTSSRPHLGRTSLLKTAIATVCTDYIRCEANILFDERAQRSFITRTLANQIGLKTSEKESIHLSAFGGQTSAVRHLPLATLNVVTTSGEKILLRVLVIEKIATPLQTHMQQGVEDLRHLRGLKLAHLIMSDESIDISLLIGADHYWDLVEDHVIRGPGTTAVASKLGYLQSGPLPTLPGASSCTVVNLPQTILCTKEDELDLEKFWSLAAMGISPQSEKNDDEVFLENYISGSITTNQDGSYNAKFPWNDDSPILPTNYNKSSTPHLTTPAWMTAFFVDPPFQNNRCSILLRFRTFAYGLSTDIEKAFLHVGLDDSDRDFTRFFWLSNPEDPESEFQVYRFKLFCLALYHFSDPKQRRVHKTGGFWERLIGLTKKAVRKTLGRASVTFVELQTPVVEIKATLNDRPITYVSSHIGDEEPLTPSHLLYGRRITSLPFDYGITSEDLTDPGHMLGNGSDMRRRAKMQGLILQRFWNRWRHEYLTSLHEFHSTTGTNNQSIKKGEVVLVHDDTHRLTWKLAVIDSLIEGADGLVRAANIRTNTECTNHPIANLYHLEISADVENQDGPSRDNTNGLATNNSNRRRAPTSNALSKISVWKNSLRGLPEDFEETLE
ncbi:hypothetical protein AWC38_SpisGene12298 [Stylophora pistillata]|uniref:DUF5641 domain-containing protein n=1 Tax=Stylophora pistillata TaxID=50429 RepID=A0A2B4S3Q5_STYPI|nr:hypothetical protein AWC38_SpisGene12298 [Stylophora pistillata]